MAREQWNVQQYNQQQKSTFNVQHRTSMKDDAF